MEITFEKAVSIISAILNFLALLVIFFTLLEMKIQRNNQYKPNLIFERGEYLLKTTVEEEEDIASREPFSHYIPLKHYDSMCLKFRNIGTFPARDIKVSIKKKNISSIKRVFSCIDFSLPEGESSFYILKESNNSTIYINPETNLVFPYLLGNGQSEEQVAIPGIYTLLLEKIMNRVQYHESIGKFVVEVNLEYSDIAKKRYFEKTMLYINLSYISFSNEGLYESAYVISMVKD